MNYTKGEWAVRKFGTIYEVYVSSTTYTIAGRIFRKPDAHLIAAAPRMYEALKLWAEHQEGTKGHYCETCGLALEEALAKAEGK